MNKFKIISFLILTSFSSFLFAGAAEDLYRNDSIIDKAISTRSYSSATGHDFTVGGVKAANGQVSADISQRVVVDGSSATVKQKVTIPANDAFYKKTAGFAKSILKGGAIGIAGSLAMQKLLDGVGYVIDEGGQIKKIDETVDITSEAFFVFPDVGSYSGRIYNVCSAYSTEWKKLNSPTSQYPDLSFTGVMTDTGVNITCNYYYYPGAYTTKVSFSYTKNPNYKNPNPPRRDVPDAEINDAFSNWFKNNPSSVTDPVTTYIYSPKTPTGAPATTPQNNPSWGQQEITDDMMNNYIENRNAELYAADVAARQAAVQDSAQTETESNPDGSKTTTKNNPDGSKTETKTETKTNPDTGEVETTVTETVINPDGTRGPSKQTETKTETKPNPETSKLPPSCEYFAVLCDWIGWTKENPEIEPFDIPEKELQEKQIKKDLISVSAPSCPPDQHFDIQGLPFGISINKNYSMQPICNTLEPLKYVFLLITLCGCGFMILRI